MMDGVRNGKIDTIIVKDLSRFGRDYIGVGEYMEQIFPLRKSLHFWTEEAGCRKYPVLRTSESECLKVSAPEVFRHADGIQRVLHALLLDRLIFP